MLKKINEGGVEGPNFMIQIMDPETLLYRTIDKTIEVSLDYEPSKRVVYIYASEVNALERNEKIIMIDNLKQAIKLLTGNFQVI